MATDLTLQAPPGMFRVVGVDTFDGTDWVDDDYEDLNTAKLLVEAKTRGKQMLIYHIYDDQGKHVHKAGSF